MLGGHCVSTKCRRQSVIALSSGEAEFYACVSAISRSIGLQQLCSDWDVKLTIQVGMDSTAGLAMQTRQGLGKAKHISTQYLWAQDCLQDGSIKLTKVNGTRNRADLLTKHLSRPVLESHLNRLGYRFVPSPSSVAAADSNFAT